MIEWKEEKLFEALKILSLNARLEKIKELFKCLRRDKKAALLLEDFDSCTQSVDERSFTKIN